jgi:hypothetical protein
VEVIGLTSYKQHRKKAFQLLGTERSADTPALFLDGLEMSHSRYHDSKVCSGNLSTLESRRDSHREALLPNKTGHQYDERAWRFRCPKMVCIPHSYGFRNSQYAKQCTLCHGDVPTRTTSNIPDWLIAVLPCKCLSTSRRCLCLCTARIGQ